MVNLDSILVSDMSDGTGALHSFVRGGIFTLVSNLRLYTLGVFQPVQTLPRAEADRPELSKFSKGQRPIIASLHKSVEVAVVMRHLIYIKCSDGTFERQL